MKFEREDTVGTDLPWLAEEAWRETLLPGGIKLDAAQFPSGATNGTLVGRTYAEAAAGTPFGVAADADEQVYLIANDVPNPADNNDAEAVRHGSLIRVNYLGTKYSALSTALKTKFDTAYEITHGTEEGKPA
jgi:hypothetical protein